MRQSPGEVIISSYFPLYRSPPPPLDAINWGYIDLRTMGFTHNREQQWDIKREQRTYYNSKLSAQVLEAALIQYCKKHPELVTYDEELWRTAYARNMLYLITNNWAYRGSSASDALTGCIIDFSSEPDDMLNFQYVAASTRIKTQKMLELMRNNRRQLEIHIKRRYSDSRYRYFHRKAYKDPEYWMNTNNWTGFKAGFIVDLLFCRLIRSAAKYEVYRRPLNTVKQESRIANAITFDPHLVEMFCMDNQFRNNLANLLIAARKTWQWDVLNNPLPDQIDQLFTTTLERHRNGQSQSTQGQQGTVLQAGRGIQSAPGNGVIQGFSNIAAQASYAATAPMPGLPEDIATGIMEGRIAELAPTVEYRNVPVHRDDGAVIGTRREPVVIAQQERATTAALPQTTGFATNVPTPEQITEALRQIRGELDELAGRGPVGDTAMDPGR